MSQVMATPISSKLRLKQRAPPTTAVTPATRSSPPQQPVSVKSLASANAPIGDNDTAATVPDDYQPLPSLPPVRQSSFPSPAMADEDDDDYFPLAQPDPPSSPLQPQTFGSSSISDNDDDFDEFPMLESSRRTIELSSLATYDNSYDIWNDDLPTLDTDDVVTVFPIVSAVSRSDRCVSESATVTTATVREEIDLTDDFDEPYTLPPKPLRSYSAAAAVQPSVRRSITDFFSMVPSSAVKQEPSRPSSSSITPSSVFNKRRASLSDSKKSNTSAVKTESVTDSTTTVATTKWQFLLTGRQASVTVKSETAAVPPAASRGRGTRMRGAATSGTRGRGDTRFRYSRFANNSAIHIKSESTVTTVTSINTGTTTGDAKFEPYDSTIGVDDEAQSKNLEIIHRYELSSGFRSGPCPNHKKIPSTNIIVDGFQHSLSEPRCYTFFLSHHHSDHTIGLYRNWNYGLIYCSEITATLLVNEDRIDPSLIRALPFHQRTLVDGCMVTLIDANHCPGAAMFVFELPPFFDTDDSVNVDVSSGRLSNHGPVYLHCGDCRYCESMRNVFISPSPSAVVATTTGSDSGSGSVVHSSQLFLPSAFNPYSSDYRLPSLSHLSRLSFTGVFLDTTYCKPQYTFPPQADVVCHVLNAVKEVLEKERKVNERKLTGELTSSGNFLNGYQRQLHQRTLILVGSYSIGKEKVWLEIARKFGMKVFASPAKIRLIKQLKLFDKFSEEFVKPSQEDAELMRHATAFTDTGTDAHTDSPFTRSLAWSNFTADEVLTSDIRQARLHVVPLSYCSLQRVAEYLDPVTNPAMKLIQSHYHSVAVFRPTGWVGPVARVTAKAIPVSIIPTITSHTRIDTTTTGDSDSRTTKRKRKSASCDNDSGKKAKVYGKINLTVSIHHVPYSEHSTFHELQSLVATLAECGLQYDGIIPTVNISESEAMKQHFRPIFERRAGHTTMNEYSLQ